VADQGIASDLQAAEGMSSYAALVESVRRLTLVSKASMAMLMREEPRDILADVYALLRAELRLDCCFNYLVEDDATKLRLNFAAGVTDDQETSLEWLDFGQAVCGVVAVQRAEIVREDVQAARDPMVDLIRSMGITAYVCEPLMAGDRLVGTFSVGTRGRTRFLREEIALLRSISAPLAFALDRRRLIRNERLLRQRGDRLQALTAALSSSATPIDVASAVIEHTTAMFGAVGTVITRLTRNGHSLEILGARAIPEHIRNAWAVFPVESDAPLAEVVRTGDTIVIESPEEWSARYPHLAGMLEESGQHSLIAVPLVIESRNIGSMGVAFGRARRFTRDDHNVVSIIAQHCAQALERARLLEAEQLARQALESSDREKAELLASVSHDLRTPLNAIGGYVQLLQMGIRGELTEGQERDLDRIAGNQRHLLHLVEELLRFSKETASPQPRELKRVPVTDALRAALDSVAPQAAAKQIELTIVPVDGLAVEGDPARIHQVLMNILANAVKFTPPGGRVTLSADAPAADTACLRVSDSGPGIPSEMHGRIFEPFSQLEGRPAGSDGVGLGLAISRTLARASGGDITVESVPGDGATFVVSLPRAL
jgi:signal transduction histidine kinase